MVDCSIARLQESCFTQRARALFCTLGYQDENLKNELGEHYIHQIILLSYHDGIRSRVADHTDKSAVKSSTL
jgi:hypothetical protein